MSRRLLAFWSFANPNPSSKISRLMCVKTPLFYFAFLGGYSMIQAFQNNLSNQILNICSGRQVRFLVGLLMFEAMEDAFWSFARQSLQSDSRALGRRKKSHFKHNFFIAPRLIWAFWNDLSSQILNICYGGQVWRVVVVSPWLCRGKSLQSFARRSLKSVFCIPCRWKKPSLNLTNLFCTY